VPRPRIRLGDRAARRRRHRRVAIGGLALLVVGGGLVALAPDDGDGSDPFRRQATSICDDSAAELTDARQAILSADPSDDAAAQFLRTAFVDLSRQRARALRALDPPAGDAARFGDLLDQYEAVLDQVEADPSRFLRLDPFTALNPRWDDFGLPACGSRTGS
jgi:hypothetical protein